MRNLLEYPITAQEVLSHLQQTYDELVKPPIQIGSLGGCIQHGLLSFFIAHPTALNELIEQLKIHESS